MFTNFECRARERQRKKECRRQASEAQLEKDQQRSRARDKKTRETFFCWKNSVRQAGGSEKKSERLTRTTFPPQNG